MSNRLVIVGAGSHGKMCSTVAKKMNLWREILFIDDKPMHPVFGIQVKNMNVISQLINSNTDFFVGIGDNRVRKNFIEQLISYKANIVNLIDSSAIISSFAQIELGTVIMPGAIINVDSSIGQGTIVNSGAIIEHDCQIGDYCHISPGVTMAGNVRVGNETTIGIGSTIIQNIHIESQVFIGAQSNVVSNINTPGTYYGSPARYIKS